VELEIAGYHEEQVTLANRRYLVPGQAILATTGLENFDRSWDPGGRPLGPSNAAKAGFGKASQQKRGEREAWCFDRRWQHAKTRYCVDAQQPLLLELGTDKKNRTEFLDYAQAGAQMFPRKVEIRKPLMASMEIRDISVSYQALDAGLFAAPPQSVELGGCENMQPPVPVYTPEPDTGGVRQYQGTIVVLTLIDADGRVASARVLNPTGDGLDARAENVVRTWKFRPAMCAGHPVATQMRVEVAFKLN
ncbi:MAG TPA: energy transducer TonB, partial [Candidatus Limnocylindrales bacterium]|nr:energy transducer TonB [Candidatus Limnocylindrales bacterium]